MQYFEVENSTNEDIEVTLSGTTYKTINIPSNRIIVVEKPEDSIFIDSSDKLVIRQIP